MAVFYILLAISITLACVFVLIQHPQKPLLSFFLKGLSSVSIVLLAVYAACLTNITWTTSGVLFIAGLLLCVLGDVCLALLEFKIKDAKYSIINSGETAFFLAQVCFIFALAFLIGGSIAITIPLIFGLLCVAIIYLMQKPMGLDYNKSTISTLIYSFGLSSSFALSVSNLIVNGFTLANVLICVGFIFFFASDLILSMIYFKDDSPRSLYYPNLATYYIAIILIAASLVCF